MYSTRLFLVSVNDSRDDDEKGLNFLTIMVT